MWELSCSNGSLAIADLERLFDQEVQAWGGEPRGLFAPTPPRETKAWLRRQLEQPHDATDLDAYIFRKSIGAVWQEIWYALNPDDQRRILASPSSIRSFMTGCCPLQPPNAEKIGSMLDSGQLEVHGGVTSVERRHDGFAVRLAETTEHADYVVNAVTPPVYGVHPSVERLVTSAVDHGLARRHHAGGLEVTVRSSAVLGSRPPRGLYALGDLTRGAFFFTSGMPALVHRSADIAAAIHHDMHERVVRLPPPRRPRQTAAAASTSPLARS